jgi:hypothetical protein
MRALRLRARAKEVDAVVLKSVQGLCASWWQRWKLVGGDEAPSVSLQALGAGKDSPLHSEPLALGFAEIDEFGVGYAVGVADASVLLRSVLGRTIQDAKFGEFLVSRLFQDLVNGCRQMTSIRASAQMLDCRVPQGRQWTDARASARQFTFEQNGSQLAWGRLSAAAVDALGPEPMGVYSTTKTLSVAEAFSHVEADCQVHLHLEGLRWSDVSSCKKGDLLLGKHGLEAPVSLLVEGRVAPLSMQLYDLDGAWSVRIN